MHILLASRIGKWTHVAGAASAFPGRARRWAGARAGGGYSPIIGASNSRVGTRTSLSHKSRACDDGVTRAIRPGETHGAEQIAGPAATGGAHAVPVVFEVRCCARRDNPRRRRRRRRGRPGATTLAWVSAGPPSRLFRDVGKATRAPPPARPAIQDLQHSWERARFPLASKAGVRTSRIGRGAAYGVPGWAKFPA